MGLGALSRASPAPSVLPSHSLPQGKETWVHGCSCTPRASRSDPGWSQKLGQLHLIAPNSCIPPAPEEDAAVLRCGASLAPCNSTGFVPLPHVPSRDPQVPRGLKCQPCLLSH